MKKFGSISAFRSASPNTTQSDSDESVSSGGRKPREQTQTQTEDNVNLNTASRAELIRYVEAISKQSATYERRFKDMVRAYKHLQTERDTLETSLKASLTQRSLSLPSETGGEGDLSNEVSVLTQAVATLTEEKSRVETQYQEDKKESLQEERSQRRTLTDNLEQAERDLGELLRERQGLKEEAVRLRGENNQLLLESGQLRERITQLELSERDDSRYLGQILSLQRQVEEWSEMSRVSELKGEETDRVLREQRVTLGEQELKLSKLECELRQANRRRDETAADLEARVAELSGIVGRYQEQVLSQEREISQLRQEDPLSPQTGVSSSHLDTLIELREQRAALHSSLQTVLRQVVGDRVGVESACAMSTSELIEALGGERGRWEVVPLTPPQTDSDKLCEEYRRRLEETEALLRGREEQLMGELSREREEGQRSSLQFERDTERNELEKKSRVGQVESQLIRLREHTVSLLADKDSEICRLKSKHGTLPFREQQPMDSAVNQLLSVSGYYSDNNTSVHLSQTRLRDRDKLRGVITRSEELETAVRDAESRELKHLEQLSFLQNEINRLDNSLARQGTNLEYLKNVVLQFVTGTGGKRRELFVPLSAVLKLSADESRLLSKSINPKW